MSDFNADHAAVLVLKELFDAGAVEHLGAVAGDDFTKVLGHRLSAAFEFKGAAVGVLGEERQVVRDELHAYLFMQPVDRGADIVGVERDLGRVVEVVAVGHEVLDHGLGRVFRGAEGLLELGALGDDLTAGDGGGAADVRHLLDEDDVHAVHAAADRGGHAGTAAAHDDHVGFKRLLAAGLLDGERNEVGGIDAGLLDAVGDGFADGFGGDGGARHAVNGGRLGGDHAAGKEFNGLGADAHGLGLLRDLDVGELVGGKRHFDGDVAVDAGGGGRVGAGLEARGGGGGRKGRGNCKGDQSLLHNKFLNL